MNVKFYNVKKRQSVEKDVGDCYKVVYRRETSKGTQERYAVRSQDDDGTNLTKFINKQTFDSLNCPVSE